MSDYNHTFELLGEEVNIETNDNGSHLFITFGDTVIEDSFGDCFCWKSTLLLSGAAEQSNIEKQLKDAAIESIKSAFQNS